MVDGGKIGLDAIWTDDRSCHWSMLREQSKQTVILLFGESKTWTPIIITNGNATEIGNCSISTPLRFSWFVAKRITVFLIARIHSMADAATMRAETLGTRSRSRLRTRRSRSSGTLRRALNCIYKRMHLQVTIGQELSFLLNHKGKHLVQRRKRIQ